MASTNSPDWTTSEAPSIDDIEAMAKRAFMRLAKDFRRLCEDVIIRVEDFPAAEVLDDLGIDDELDLLGLFQGVGLAQGGGAASGRCPIWCISTGGPSSITGRGIMKRSGLS